METITAQNHSSLLSDSARSVKASRNSHLRSVKWLWHVPRTHFSQGAPYEIGSAISLSLAENYGEAFRSAVEGKQIPVTPVEEDETVAAVAEDVEENTCDFVLKHMAQDLKGLPFANFVADLLGTMGYRTRVLPASPDDGIDDIANREELGFEPAIIKVQVKSGDGSVGNPEVAALNGNVGTTEFGLLVTLGTFTPRARNFARSKSNLRLIDGEELVRLIYQHDDQFDSCYKGLIQLRRVYVPEVIESEEA